MASAAICSPLIVAPISGASTLADPGVDPGGGASTETRLVVMAAPGSSRKRRPRSVGSSHRTSTENGPVTRSRKEAVVPPARPSKSPTRRTLANSAVHVDSAHNADSTWDMMGHLFSWGFVIFIVLIGLISTFWNWQEVQNGMLQGPSAKELAEMDSSLRKTTKWMQAQLDLIDMKIGKEVAGLKREVEHMIDAEAFSINSKVHSMKAQMESVEASFSVLRKEGILTKQETIQLIRAVADNRAMDGSGNAVNLDDVRAAAKRIIEEELERHRADGIGRTDYALASGGGKVIDYSEGYFYPTPWSGFLGLLPGDFKRHPKANKILEPSFGEPGQCLPLKGSNVYVDIRLRTAIYPDSITLEHVSKRVAYDTGSAPKDSQLFGWLETPSVRNSEKVLLGEFTYNIDKSSVQTFKLSKAAASKLLINTVRLHVLSNYGSPTHTCLYRIRVHGTPREATPAQDRGSRDNRLTSGNW